MCGLHNFTLIRIFALAMTNEEYIELHRREKVHSLALRKADEGVDIKWCLQQIEGWQKACDKLPHWAQTKGLWYPLALSMEQCSSEHTAKYKAEVASRLMKETSDRQTFADLTGGYGIDFSYIAPLFSKSYYIERNPELCRIAKHNFELLHLDGSHIISSDSIEYLQQNHENFSLIYIDPARRDNIGKKIVAISDCTPNLEILQEQLLTQSRYVMTKLSPMLDISAALRVLKGVREIHAVSLKGECKELLFVQDTTFKGNPFYVAVNLGSRNETFLCTHEQKHSAQITLADTCPSKMPGYYLYEPNASILKAGIQDFLCERFGVSKLHPMSNLFISSTQVADFPGRAFKIVDSCGFSKKEIRNMLKDIKKANITVRNFPTGVAELRKKLRLDEGGDVYLFATTIGNGSHVLFRCSK